MKKENSRERIPKTDRVATPEELAQIAMLAEQAYQDKPGALQQADWEEGKWWQKLLRLANEPGFDQYARGLGYRVTVERKDDGSIKAAEIKNIQSGELLYYYTDKELPKGPFGPEAYREQG